MTKALLTWANAAAVASGQFGNLFRTGTAATEALAQIDATESFTITDLEYSIASGGSGVNDVRVRKNTANGNLLASRTGAGKAVDSVNSDSFVNGDLLALSFTDTGTDPVYDYIRACIEFASGHGNLHAAINYAGVSINTASATRHMAIAGDLGTLSANTNISWRNRGYTSVESLQLNVSANARTTDTVFQVQVNGSNVGSTITYTAAETGRKKVVGMGASIADGDTVTVRCTTLAGTENITLRTMTVVMKSSSKASDVITSSLGGVVRAASATPNYYPPGSFVSFTTDAAARIRMGFAGNLRGLRLRSSVNTYTADATIRIFVNGVVRMTQLITAGAGAAWYENTSDRWEILPTDEVSLEIVGGSTGSATFHLMGFTIDPPPALANVGQISPFVSQAATGLTGFSGNINQSHLPPVQAIAAKLRQVGSIASVAPKATQSLSGSQFKTIDQAAPKVSQSIQGATFNASSCIVEPTGAFFWLWENGAIIALEDCSGGWMLENQTAAPYSGEIIQTAPKAQQAISVTQKFRATIAQVLSPFVQQSLIGFVNATTNDTVLTAAGFAVFDARGNVTINTVFTSAAVSTVSLVGRVTLNQDPGLKKTTQMFSPGKMVILYELSGKIIGVEPLRFTAGSLGGAHVLFGGREYAAIPIEAEGFEWNGRGPLPQPTLKIANITSPLTAIVANLDDLLGCRFRRIRTFEQFLDTGTDPDQDSTLADDVYYLEQRKTQNQVYVEFALNSLVDQEGVLIPREIALKNICRREYRTYNPETNDFDYTTATCRYNGPVLLDPKGNPTSKAGDSCGKRIPDCEKRFGKKQPLATTAMPGLGEAGV